MQGRLFGEAPHEALPVQDDGGPTACVDCAAPVEDAERCPICSVLHENWLFRGAPGGDYAAWQRDGGYERLWRENGERVAAEKRAKDEQAKRWKKR